MSTETHTVGSRVWVKNDSSEDVWQKGEVVRLDPGGSLVVRTEKGEDVVDGPDAFPLQNLDAQGVEDMTCLSYLHEPGVLWNLKSRYMVDDIYTYTGTILIAVNPFAALPHLYGSHMMDQYRGAQLGELLPHVYAIADAAYRQMCREWKGQSILVSGESGAGKTETSKLIMKYLAHMGGYTESGEAAAQGPGSRSVEEQVLESNPLLEAFGNAKTVRNDNSSRFGKYVEINFNRKGVISGAAIRTYLLERSRVVAVNNPERNYHVFYQLCAGASPEERQRWRLTQASDYHYLSQSSCYELAGVDNAEEYKRTVLAMTRVGLPASDREAIFRTVAAILNLGNIGFAPADGGESCVVQAGSGDHAALCAAELLGVDKAALVHALTTRTRQTPEGPIVSPLDVKAATENRDSLAKILYSKMFDWLVACINAAIGEDKNCAASVGVLDIYGFESFALNDFEQFCINLANEKLQQHFNQHVFKMEQAEYEREQIDWSYIQFVDNQDVLDLIEGKMGILELLDEQCRFPTSTGADLAQKLYSTPTCKDSRRFSKPKRSNQAFTVDHYAGGVTYETTNFMDKNKDFVVTEHQTLMASSSLPFVAQLFQEALDTAPKESKAFKGFKFNSVGSQFKKQLAELMAQLQVMEPHYVRCIKPNSLNQPMLFEGANVLQQLRCGGVLEAVRISCAGFPAKRPYPDFVDHFWPLAPDLLRDTSLDDRSIARAIVQRAGIEGHQLGTTKVFLRAGHMAQLDKLRTDKLNTAALCIQRHCMGFLARKRFHAARHATMVLQSAARGLAARQELMGLRKQKAALTIQRHWHGYRARTAYAHARQCIGRIQAIWRGRNARSLFERTRRLHAALAVQAIWRMRCARTLFLAQQEAICTLQRAFRCKVAKAELRQLRQSAREGTKLLEDKKVLEARCQELQGTLEVVQNQRNELRHQIKEERAALVDKEHRLKEAEQKIVALEATAATAAASGLEEEQAARAKAEQEVEALKAEVAAAAEAATKARADTERKLEKAQDYIQRSLAERSELEKKFHAMKDDLITRLQNACGQRDEARAQVLELQNTVEQQREQLALKERQLSAAAASVSAVANMGAPGSPHTPLNAQDKLAPLMSGVQRAPGMAKAMYDSMASSLTGLNLPMGIPGSRGQGDDMSGRSPMTPGMAASTPPAGESELERKTRELQAKQQALIQEKRRAEEERLLSAIATNVGFSRGRPLAAIMIFRCCLQWRAFQADRTTLFDRIIGAIGNQIEKHQESNEALAYWLTNTVTLLNMLQKNIKPASGSGSRRPVTTTARAVFGGLFGRSTAASPTSNLSHADASIHGGGVGGFKQVEAKYPALLFKQQLDAFVQKIFPMIRDNVKKQISPMVSNCIHTPKGLSARPRAGAAAEHGTNSQAAALSKSWGDILAAFDDLLATLKTNAVPKVLVQALFRQLFSFMNVQLFNQLLLRRECCSFSNGEYVKTGLLQVENWLQSVGPEFAGDSWDELRYIRQAVTFLVIGSKGKKKLSEITNELCPVLSIQQLYRISTMYWDDRYNTESVSHEVLAAMKQKMVEGNSSSSHSFLLDDDSTLPFAAAEVLGAMDDKDLYTGIPLPAALKDPESSPAGSFTFLEKELRFSQPASAGAAAPS